MLKLQKGLIQVATGNTGASMIGALFWLFIASIMLVEDYGSLNYYLSMISILSSVSLFGLQNVVITYLARGNTDVKFQANLLVLVSNIIILPFLFIITQNIPVLLALVGLSFYTMSWAEIIANKRYKRFSSIIMAQRAVQVLLSVALFFVMGVDGIILGYAISTLIFAYNFFRSFGGFSATLRALRKRKSFVIHSYAAAISNSITNFADKLLVAPLFGFAILGLYQISFQFLMFLSVVPLSIFQFMLPRESTRMANKKLMVIGPAVAVAFSMTFYFTIPWIIESFFPHFAESIPSSQIMVFGVIPMTVNAIMTSKMLGRETSQPVFIAAIVYLLTLSLLFLFLGQELGLMGLGIAVLASLTLQSIALFIMSVFQREHTARLPTG
jgi:O-antigen/teichoic acid export membrane protein